MPTTVVTRGVEELIFRTRVSIFLLVMTAGFFSRRVSGLAVSTVALVMTWVTLWRWENWIRAIDWTGHRHAFNDLAGLGTTIAVAMLTVMLGVIIAGLLWRLSSKRET